MFSYKVLHWKRNFHKKVGSKKGLDTIAEAPRKKAWVHGGARGGGRSLEVN